MTDNRLQNATALFVTVLCTLLLSACQSGRRAMVPNTEVSRLNSELADSRNLMIEFENGDVVRKAGRVRIGATETSFEMIAYGTRRTVSTETIKRILRKEGGAGSTGFIVGALPGLIFAGASATSDGDDSSGVGEFVRPIGILSGLAIAAGGALIVGSVFDRLQPAEWVVVYEKSVAGELP